MKSFTIWLQEKTLPPSKKYHFDRGDRFSSGIVGDEEDLLKTTLPPPTRITPSSPQIKIEKEGRRVSDEEINGEYAMLIDWAIKSFERDSQYHPILSINSILRNLLSGRMPTRFGKWGVEDLEILIGKLTDFVDANQDTFGPIN